MVALPLRQAVGGLEFQRQRLKSLTSRRVIAIPMPLLQMIPAPGVGDHLAAGGRKLGCPATPTQLNTTTPGVKLVFLLRRKPPRIPRHMLKGPSRRQAQGEVDRHWPWWLMSPPSPSASEIGHAPGVVAFLGALQSPIRSLHISMVALK